VLELEARLGGLETNEEVGDAAATEVVGCGSQATPATSCQGSQVETGSNSWGVDNRNSASQTDRPEPEKQQPSPSQTSQIQMDNLRRQLESMQAILSAKDAEIIQLRNDMPIKPPTDKPVDRFENMFMTSLEVESQQKNMQQLELDLKTQEIARLREVHESELQELKQERNQLEKEVLEGRHKIDELQENQQRASTDYLMESQLRDAAAKLEELQNLRDAKSVEMEGKLKEAAARLGEATEQVTTLQSEQEDLLVMLADQEVTMEQYKQRLRELGATVEEDDNDDLT